VTLRIQDLQSMGGLDRLSLALGLDNDQKSKVKSVVDSYLKASPHLGTTEVGKAGKNISFYNFKKDILGLGHTDPAVIAHELGHADSLKDSSDLYKSLLSSSKRATKLNRDLALPVSAGVGLLLNKNKDMQQDILRKATLVSLGLAAPNLIEEALASYKGTKHSPEKLRAAINMLPGLASHTMHDLTPALTYAGAMKLLELNRND
jgi:hypothetical protein